MDGCSIIIPVFNRAELTEQCLRALISNTSDVPYEVIIVDNGSTDGTADLLAKLQGSATIIANDHNLGFARACNQGAAAANTETLVFLNNDTEPEPGWLPALTTPLANDPELGAVGCKLLFPDRTVQHGGVVLVERPDYPQLGAVHLPYHVPEDDPLANRRRHLSVVTAACVALRRAAFEEVGGFDEGYWNGYEDVDLCLALGEAGWKILYEPTSVLIHHESASGEQRFVAVDSNIERLQKRWYGKAIPDIVMHDMTTWDYHPDSSFAESLDGLELTLR